MTNGLTSAQLNDWRKRRGLYVHELASLFGYTLSKMKDRLYGRIEPCMTAIRMTRNIDMLLHVGVPPDGWPHRLRHRVHVNRIADTVAGYDRIQSPENLC